MPIDDDPPYQEVKRGKRKPKGGKSPKARTPVTDPRMLSGKRAPGTGGSPLPHKTETARSAVSSQFGTDNQEHNKLPPGSSGTGGVGANANRVTDSPAGIGFASGGHPNVTNRLGRSSSFAGSIGGSPTSSTPSLAQAGTNDTPAGDNMSTAASITSSQRNEALAQCLRLDQLVKDLRIPGGWLRPLHPRSAR